MNPFTSWSRSVDEVVRQGRIGTPVSVRVVDLTAADHGHVEANLARAIEAAWGWLGSAPSFLRASGDVEAGHVTAMLRFASGASAAITAGVSGVSVPRLEAHVVGNTGVVIWEPPDPNEPTDDHDPPLGEQGRPPVPPDQLRVVLRAILSSSAQGRTVRLGDAGDEGSEFSRPAIDVNGARPEAPQALSA
ncbi:MAG: hypothetical protein AB7I30_01880, partial [Isosphaeraceae bacterium]